jgi:hypothetical protein
MFAQAIESVRPLIHDHQFQFYGGHALIVCGMLVES